ncbi:MAG TPA: IgGFc-binding protein [Polyangiaceae bacterium]|nr:IgGFc-binding protein [Polyangiaceae bacterium]HNZ20719.1 IgGFc-binding protein [Polyangiaceae bacterium]HOD20666.1 IgGFc-binding protein [Polyangiaceae bacterium]HOE49136.1 IgGFc-binding protein [Polyangiaceae bacterium]HOG99249.1 IgGFc-binding protein [Polyangiaceae bacterium]
MVIKIGSSTIGILCVGLGVACSAGGGDGPGGGNQAAAGSSGAGGTTPWAGGSGGGESSLYCTPGAWSCSGKTYYLCGQDGLTHEQETQCPQACKAGVGCVACESGTRSCDGTVSMVCAADGSGWIPGRDCADWGTTCGTSGFCDDACAQAERTDSYVGCEYWPTPLANTSELSYDVFDYRVVVGNPNTSKAHVIVTRGSATAWEGDVSAGGLVEIPLPWIDGQSFGIPGDAWKSIAVMDGAYRLRSDQPVTVAQFNPFEYSAGGTFSYTNDATLLLPSHVLTGDYINLTYVPLSLTRGATGMVPTPPSSSKFADYLAVVGVSPGVTNVRIQVSSHTAGEQSNRFGPTGPAGWIEFSVQRGEVVHVAAAPPANCAQGRPGYSREEDCFANICDYQDTCFEHEHDMTGSRVVADRPVQVFGGHVCAYVPYMSQACDHLEVQVPPIQTWGKQYVSRPMTDGAISGQNLVRVVAAFDGTEVTVSPPQGGIDKIVLDANRWVEFMASGPFSVSGTNAIMVGQFLLGQSFPDPEAQRGDPAMTVLVPFEQYRKDYIFVTPSSYSQEKNGQNYLLIIRPPGMALSLDGSAVTATWEAMGGREVGIVAVDGGTHTITGESAFGMIAYGLGSYTSYAYPAGLNLNKITDVVK